MGTGVHLVEGSLRGKMDEPTVFPSSVDVQKTRAQLVKIGGNRKCPENVHLRSEQAVSNDPMLAAKERQAAVNLQQVLPLTKSIIVSIVLSTMRFLQLL